MKSNKRILFAVLGVVIIFVVIVWRVPSCTATYKGKVIDAVTKLPIEGAVVVASWSEEQGTPTGGTSRFHDVKETLTDKNGEWKIKGPRGARGDFLVNVYTILSMMFFSYYTEPPLFIIFNPGYCSYPQGFGIDACKEKIKPSGRNKIIAGETIELPKLTSREDRLEAQRIWPSLKANEGDKETLKKIKNFIQVKNDEHRYLGLQEMYKEIEHEK